MPNVKKLIEKMKEQPNGVRPEEVEKVLGAYGYIPVRQKGSHKHYLNKETGDLITIKQENPLKKSLCYGCAEQDRKINFLSQQNMV